MSRCAPLPGSEYLQSDLLRGLPVPRAVDANGHVHRGLPGTTDWRSGCGAAVCGVNIHW
jgi:hypothetical protein